MARYFDRILLPEQLLSALPEAMRVLTNPAETGTVVIALPQDVQSKSFDFPDIFFDEHDWEIGRVVPREIEVQAAVRALERSERPLVLAGGGVIYSDASAELTVLAESLGIPVAETFAGKGAVEKGRVVGCRRHRRRGEPCRQRSGARSRSRPLRGYPPNRLRHCVEVIVQLRRSVRVRSTSATKTPERKVPSGS